MPHKKQSSTRHGYAGKKARTNLSLDRELTEIAKDLFPKTRHGSLSGFVENKLRSFYRTEAPKLRALGVVIPAGLFLK